MAWVNIPDTATDPDAPLTSSLAKAWTGNFKGMADGDPGAPRITRSAILGPIAGTSYTITEASGTQPNATASVRLISFISGGEITVSTSGTNPSIGSGGASKSLRLRTVNGGVTNIYNNQNLNYNNTRNISVPAGGVLIFSVSGDSNTSGGSYEFRASQGNDSPSAIILG